MVFEDNAHKHLMHHKHLLDHNIVASLEWNNLYPFWYATHGFWRWCLRSLCSNHTQFFKVDAWEPYAWHYCNQSYNAHVFSLQLWPALHHEGIVVLEPLPCCSSCACIITSLKSGYLLLQCSFYKMFIFCFASCWLKLVSNLVFKFLWIFLNLILLL
jgi:hypothetical protein